MKIIKVIFIIQTGIVFFSSLVYADSPARKYSYKKITANGRYVFVMLRPISRSESFEGYTISGLYENDGSKKPLWMVVWYAHEVKIASDGVHLVKHGPWASNQDQEAISFYSKGFLVRSYKIKELVSFPFLMPHTVSHFYWRAYENLDDKRLLFTLITLHGDYYAFDIRTGKIVSSFKGSIWFSIVISLTLLITVLLKRKLFLFLLILISIFLVLISFGLVLPIGIFLGLWVSGNIISMLSSFASQISQKWVKALNRLRRSKFLLVFASIMVSIFIVDFFLTQIKIQIYKPMPIASSPFNSKDYLKKVVSKDERYIAYRYGIVFDTRTGIEWVVEPKDINWWNAKNWTEFLHIGGGHWRMPTINEFKTLHQKGSKWNMSHLLVPAGFKGVAWSGETNGSEAKLFYFSDGQTNLAGKGNEFTAFAVRSRSK